MNQQQLGYQDPIKSYKIPIPPRFKSQQPVEARHAECCRVGLLSDHQMTMEDLSWFTQDESTAKRRCYPIIQTFTNLLLCFLLFACPALANMPSWGICLNVLSSENMKITLGIRTLKWVFVSRSSFNCFFLAIRWNPFCIKVCEYTDPGEGERSSVDAKGWRAASLIWETAACHYSQGNGNSGDVFGNLNQGACASCWNDLQTQTSLKHKIGLWSCII